MANMVFDFLTESFLFDQQHIDNHYKTVSEDKLHLELQNYRKHVQENYQDIIKEIQNKNELNITIESSGELPNEQLLKQLALYMDKVAICDPIFEFTHEKSSANMQIGELLSVNSDDLINRNKLANAAKYMKRSTPLVASQFVKYVPISLIHEPPKQIPLLYSENNYSNDLPKELYEFFYENVVVNNICISNGEMTIHEDEPLQLGTTIAIYFKNRESNNTHVYQYLASEVVSMDDETRRVVFRNYVPEHISENDFLRWVQQSINRAAISEVNTVLHEAIYAKKLQCMYMAKSEFTSDLLKKTVSKQGVNADLSNLAMNLELPVLDSISLDDLVAIRSGSGEAFHNFRTSLNSKLLQLRDITDKDKLNKALENVSYEISNLQVKDVQKEYRKIIKTLGIDAALLTGSLITNFCTGGLTLIGTAGAVLKTSADYKKYLNEFKENNGYFMWKINRQKQIYVL